MKKIPLLLFICGLFTFNSVEAQKSEKKSKGVEEVYQYLPFDSVQGKYIYEELIQVEGISQKDIYTRAKAWIVRSLKSSDNMTQLDDPTMSSLVATGFIGMAAYQGLSYGFKWSVYCKEGRYKVIIDNFNLNNSFFGISGPLEEPNNKKILGPPLLKKSMLEISEKNKAMIQDLKSAIASGSIPGDQGDW
ncbi:MAG: DUF4468 domain-containing protein [Bacteroidia bacterium]